MNREEQFGLPPNVLELYRLNRFDYLFSLLEESLKNCKKKKECIIRDLRLILNELIKSSIWFQDAYKTCRPCERWFIEDQIAHIEKVIEKRYKNLMYMETPDESKEKFDLDYILSIPIDHLVEITPSGFFVENPFRKERSPSNSLHWNKKTNLWTDYGTGKHGDIINLFMKLYDVDFRDACKQLTKY